MRTNIGTPSVLQIQSTDTSESTINIITKGINFTNAIDNTNQLIIDNEGVFLKEIYRDWVQFVVCNATVVIRDF